jgi:signal transduction histidine kinase
LDTHRLAAGRIDDLLGPLSDQQIRDQEQALHERISQQIKDLPQIAAAWALDASGRELVSAKVYPVNRDLTYSDREDFTALQNLGARVFVWALRARSFEHNDLLPYFTVAHRREDSSGKFQGITIVSISGSYLASFFNSLLDDHHDYSANILRDNGVNLARYPGSDAEPAALQQSDPLVRAIASGSAEGMIAPTSLFDRDSQITAYQRVGSYPIYISLTRNGAAVLREWWLATSGYFAIGGAAVLGLVILCLIALRQARGEQTALAQARSLLHDREIAYQAAYAAKEEAESANQAKSYFLATMSHELRTPLHAIIGFSEVIMREDLAPIGHQKYLEYINDIHSSGEHLLRMINDILDLSKASVGKLELDESVFDLHEVVRSVKRMTAGLADMAGLSLRVCIAENLPLVRGDEGKMGQVLVNLVNNSIKFTDKGGEIAISGRFDPLHGIALIVSDTGVGIAPEDLERVMKPFEQVVSSLSRQHKGAGLGLPLVKEIIEQHDGRVELRSELGVGTTVTITLPSERTIRQQPPVDQT